MNEQTIFNNVLVAAKSGRIYQAPQAITITPDMASQLLNFNSMNRNLRERHVAQLADALERGLWDLRVGQMIQLGTFNDNPVLVDGQHRLWAITEAKVSIKATLVVIGPVKEEGCMDVVVDIGLKRNDSDILGMPTNLVRTANTLIRLAFMAQNSHTQRCWQPSDIKKVIGVIGSYLSELDHINNTKRVWCSAAGRAAMIAQMWKGEPQKHYTIEQWKAICNPALNMTPRVGSAIRGDARAPGNGFGTFRQFSSALWIYSVLEYSKRTEARIFIDADWVRAGLVQQINEILEAADVRI